MPATSADSGAKWRTAWTPYLREPLDNLIRRWVRQTTFVGSTQIGKTELLNNALAWMVAHEPSAIAYVCARAKDCRTTMRHRVLPMLRASDVLRAEITDRARDLKHEEVHLRRSTIFFRAAESPADLASLSCRYLLADETERWPEWSGRESSPFSLLQQRTITFDDYHLFLVSTPKFRHGVIQRQFEQGDQRRYHVPCQLCGRYQVLRWSQVQWDRVKLTTPREIERSREVWLECERCKGKIVDQHKPAMLAAGVWVPGGQTVEEWRRRGALEDREPHRSYHLWAAYSPWVQFWRLAAEFTRTRDVPADFMGFVNLWLAECWVDRVEDTPQEAVEACVDEQLSQGPEKVPEFVKVVCAAADVQKDRIIYGVAGWGDGEECAVLALGEVATFEDLDAAVFGSSWGSKHFQIRCMVVDSRHRRDEVIEFVRKRRPVARAIAGVERQAPIPFGTIKIERHPRTGQPLEHSLTCWTVNVGFFKDLVAARIAASAADPEKREGRLHLPKDLDPRLLLQLSAEHKVRERSGNRERARWVLKPGRGRNDAWDVLIYLHAAARMARVDLLRGRGPGPGPAPGEGGAPPPRRPGPPRRQRSILPIPRLSR